MFSSWFQRQLTMVLSYFVYQFTFSFNNSQLPPLFPPFPHLPLLLFHPFKQSMTTCLHDTPFSTSDKYFRTKCYKFNCQDSRQITHAFLLWFFFCRVCSGVPPPVSMKRPHRAISPNQNHPAPPAKQSSRYRPETSSTLFSICDFVLVSAAFKSRRAVSFIFIRGSFTVKSLKKYILIVHVTAVGFDSVGGKQNNSYRRFLWRASVARASHK